ncbi:MAG: TetR/AcrR family transcriptional regulator [Ornithinibacter sp.]
MAPDDRRRAIVDAVVPLLLEHGDAVTTRQIAEAAGIAEGTIFRVFPDKPALLLATAEETMNPATGRADLLAALEGATTLREKVLIATERLTARSERVMAVMVALRSVWMSQEGTGRHHPRHGPPQFVRDSNRAVLEMLTDVFEDHRDELSVKPATAALLLRTLVLGSRHPGVPHDEMLTPDEIADTLLDGVRRQPRAED